MKKDLREYARQTSFRLVIGVLLITLLFGNLLIFLIYGREASLFSLVCMSAALIPVGLIILALWLIEWISKKN